LDRNAERKEAGEKRSKGESEESTDMHKNERKVCRKREKERMKDFASIKET
jgi:hypothetical protein